MKITVKNFQKKIPIYPTRIKKTIRKVLSSERVAKSGEITVCFVTDPIIKTLNKKFHRRDTPTDVLAFDYRDSTKGSGLAADIIISTDTALRNAALYHSTPAQEVTLYAVHGVLHLLGYDDHSPHKARTMRAKERKYVHP